MPVSINEQTMVFLSCIAAGLIMGVIYDFFGGIRNGLSLGRGLVFILDTIFCVLGVGVFFAAIYITCGGCVRWYVFLGMALGLCFYMVTLSHLVMPFMINIVKLIRKLFIKILCIILLPVVKIIKIMSKIFAPVSCFVKNALKKHKNFVQKNVEKFRQIGIILRKV